MNIGIYYQTPAGNRVLLSKYETRSAAVARLDEARKEYRAAGHIAEWNDYGARELINVVYSTGKRACFYVDTL